MKRSSALEPSIFCGLLLLVVVIITLFINANSIGIFKNTLFHSMVPKAILKVQGNLVWAGGNFYYHRISDNLQKIDDSGKVVWEKKIKGQLLWLGLEGVILVEDNSLLMLDGVGKEVFQKADLPENIRVLCVKNDYLLLSGKLNDVEHGILLYGSGSTVWQLPIEGEIISGSLHPKGVYAVFHVIGDNAESKLIVIGPRGEYLVDSIFEVPLYQVKAVPHGICVMTGNKACLIGYDGELMWEYQLSGQVVRGDIGEDGYFAAVLEDDERILSQDVLHILIILSDEGQHICSYSLDAPATIVHNYQGHVYIVDNYGITVLSQEGLLLSYIKQKGIKQLTITDKNNIIANQEASSILLESPFGG